MSTAALPENESARLRTLRALQVLDTPNDPVLDGLVRSAAMVLGCPVALVSLVDQDRQWFKASVGLEVRETSRDMAFCAHAILGEDILEVPDAELDPRFVDNPLVTGEPRIRFYAGAPLALDGHALGTLCVIDHQPRQLNAAQRTLLRDLAAAASHWLLSRQQEQQLQQLSMAVEQSFDSVVITDLAARIEYVNAAAVASSGHARSELIGRNSRQLLSPAGNYRDMWTELTAGRPWKGLLLNRRKDGSEYHEVATISPVRQPDGRITHYLAVKEDVTEKRRMGEELERHRHHLEEQVAQRTAELVAAKAVAETANEAKSAFLATMSHEIRTPMNGVVGIVDVLRQSSLTPYQADLADTIRESAYALLSVIDDILDFSKIEAGRLLLEREPVALARLIEGVCDTLQPVAYSRGVDLQVFVDPALPDWIVGDELRLRQILTNLIGNAIKFSAGLAHPGKVAVRAEAQGPQGVRFRVIDNGIGVAPWAHAEIFQPFVQAEGSTARRYGGTGLGLTICRRLAEMLGGRIDVQSEVDHGATFTLSLPLRLAEPGEPALVPPQALDGLACHVVCADRQRAQDRVDYLEAAGAQAWSWDHIELLLPALAARAGPGAQCPVVIIDADVDDPALKVLQKLPPDLPVSLVRVGQGQRRKPRLLGPGWVTLDADALRRSALLHAVALATGRAQPDPIEASVGLPIGAASAPTLEEAVAQGRLVLVAEDNDINQRVIRRQLALLGLAAEVADGGLDALERWRLGRPEQRYGVLLTDLHMPGMDGYELSASIRREEGEGQRLPIVALTANALRGEADRCRAAGMDEFLSKPVQLSHLGATLARWLPDLVPDSRRPVGANHVVVADDAFGEFLHPVLDSSVLTKLVGDDPALLAEIRRTYLVSLESTSIAMQAAVSAADWAAAAALGHRLKSSSRAIGALALGECCDRIERAGRAGDGVAVLQQHPRFVVALAMVVARLTETGHVPAEAVRAVAPALAPPEAGVMLVDDEPVQLQMMQRQLALLGVAPVQACRAGTHALEALKGRDTSAMLLLVDLNMPGMDGVEFMRQLAEQRFAGSLALVSGADVRVLETAAKLAEAYQLNVLSHLHKPVPTPVLQTLIDRWRAFIPARARSQTKAYSPNEISRAIAGGQLLLHFQPKVALHTGALLGVEALVRWQHESDGLIYPDSFIAVAEAHGLIDELTRAVLGKALVQARDWREQGLNLRMAVNVSMDNLVRLDFPDFVHDELARHGVAPSDLVLEVTESRLMRDARAPMDILTRLRLKRIGLSIDDFGTGHSSLAQLRDIPFDELKIDRGFVHGSREHATQRAIFAASLEMAHKLGMSAVAEGVEDRADWDFVRGSGCDVAQGYFIARPMPASELPVWSGQWEARFREELSG